ncbi:MAG: SusD/RagB family nutrient-binding outer membrane lipoprotein [Bacteroidaceae bacterium]|nr:SusD/RagB family nutrient-binding outer membrane lipoprotein [Bacteroidaceae bacterium]
MKKFNKIFFTLAMGAALMGGTTSCEDFDEVNINPGVAGVEVVKAYYALNSSIIGAQQDPHIAERIAVYNWASAARISGSNSTFLSAGRYDDGYCNDYHGNSFLTGWIKNATMAITIATENEALEGASERDMKFNQNVKSFARIWRVVMVSEYTDNFGPYPIEAFQGTNPTYNSVEEVYHHMIDELKEAVDDIILDVEPEGDEAKSDPLFGFNAQKWAKYGNSLRLRLAMRLSEVDGAYAKTEFEAVDKNMLITSMADIAKVKEYNQWNAWAGIYSRSWNYIDITSTMSNILTGLGGVSVAEQRPDLVGVADFKPMNYLGLQFADHYADKTDNPTKGYWMDGIPENLDPRALRLYCLPNDEAADNFRDYGSSTNHDKYFMKDEAGDPLKYSNGDTIKILASHTWNYYPAASRTAWSPKFAKNGVSGSYPYTLPVLSKTYGGDSEGERVWFGPWETHFLLAEAAVRGWNAGVDAETAYEAGIRTSFENFGVSQFVDAYLESEDYNRIGVSVKFTHTAEPTSFEAKYVNGYDNVAGTTTYEYPNAAKSLYKGGLNTPLAKIITQKYIAQAPYCSLEIWNDRRRLGLPWFDIPNNETVMVGYDMANTWTPTTYIDGQTIGVFPQRLRYPTSLRNADEAAYNKALELLGGENTTITPLWWAIH